MLESLSSRIQGVLKDLKGEGRVSEQHLQQSMREIRLAMLEADVNFKVVRTFVSRVQEKALGKEVLQSLTPGQQIVKIVRDELTDLLGGIAAPLKFGKIPPSVILMIGLQGSGKTTTTGKLAYWLKKQGKRPFMVSTDVYRPAAIEQLRVVAQAIEVPCLEDAGRDAVGRARLALTQVRNTGFDVLLIDTAGRLHIDEELMQELDQIKSETNPTETLLVADAMTGQDAVNSAGDFNQRLSLSGVILSKMDGDARGGAALSIQSVTNTPLKFIGVGEKYDALEVFHPERMAGRILGMGDVLSLIEKAEEVVDEENAERMLRKMRKNEFSLQDFRDQLRQLKRLGPLDKLLGMLPKMGPMKQLDQLRVDEKQLLHLEAIISSMTPKERANYRIINGSRRKRISRGCGRPVSEVNRLLKQFMQTRKMMQHMSKGFSGKKLPGLNFPH